MLPMILQMTAATALYVGATVFLWRYWHKSPEHTLLQKLLVGLFYGLCSVVSNHIGVNYGTMIMNVRDLGPLAAGLFFDPLAGILSGLIGGVERYLVGEYLRIGHFTRIACSISTILAGLLPAALNRYFYKGSRPSVVTCLLVGAEMEVFHMYAVFVTNRDELSYATYVVETCSLPMILFTGFGLAACSLVIARLSGVRWKHYLSPGHRKFIPLVTHFQARVMLVILILLLNSSRLTYGLQTYTALNDAGIALQRELRDQQAFFEDNRDVRSLAKHLDISNRTSHYFYLLVDGEKMLQYTLTDSAELPVPADPEDVRVVLEHADDKPFTTVFRLFGTQEYLCCSIRLAGSYYLMGGIGSSFIHAGRHPQVLETLFLEILIFTAFYLLVEVLVKRLITTHLDRVNESLTRITDGHLNEVVSVEASSEFTKLSGDINQMVTALKGYIADAERRMDEELELAAAIQDSALPKNFDLQTDSVGLFASMTPAKYVGGDFYDFFLAGGDRLGLVMADVSGKGIPAAMFMMRAKTAIKNYALSGIGPAEILANVNNALCEGNNAHMFVTVWLGILDLKTGLMRCANAGHEYPVLMRAGGDYAVFEDRHGFVLGGFENITMEEYEIRMNPGDRLFVYTDGIPEAMNEDRKQYGMDRLTACLNSLKDGSQEQVLAGVLKSVREYAGSAEQFDDITMLGITFLGAEGG